MKEIEIMAWCSSEKTDVSIGFGITIESPDGTIDFSNTDWIWEGISDSFWENHYEFEPGLDEAEARYSKDPDITFHDALFDVFGNFTLRYEVDGVDKDLAFSYDANEQMYALLEN